jgi:hypothetical protein
MIRYKKLIINLYLEDKMRTTIKNKTELRKIIKNSIGNTGSLDYVEFYDDFSWEIMGCSTYSGNCIVRKSLAALASSTYDASVDWAISRNFANIEIDIIDNSNHY